MRCDAGGHLLEISDWLPTLLRRLFEHRLEDLRILRPFRILLKQQGRKQPLAKERPFLTDRLVQLHADQMGKSHVQVMTVDGNSIGLEQGRERAELNGGILGVTERHVDERHSYFIAHRMPHSRIVKQAANFMKVKVETKVK